MRNTNVTRTILWVLAVVYAVALIANISFGLSIPIALVLLVSVAFALIHGALRYGWRGIAAFIVICLVVSNILENTSILTGFPSGTITTRIRSARSSSWCRCSLVRPTSPTATSPGCSGTY